jgi:DNA-binding GntR family transcriptional regulator
VATKRAIAAQGVALQELEKVPLATRARAAILTAILEDQFEGRLPSEDELAEMLNVSRTTVRAAAQDLEREGLIKRRRAVGTRINRTTGRRRSRFSGWSASTTCCQSTATTCASRSAGSGAR